MKFFTYKIIFLWLCIAQLIANQRIYAQTNATPAVNISLTITPPYSPYYADYTGIKASTVLMLLQNTTNETRTIKLSGSLTGDNGIKIWTKSNYVP